MLIDFGLFNIFDQYELHDGSKQLLQNIGVTVHTNGSLPNNGGVLLISNHPGGLDLQTIFASVSRTDFYCLALAGMQNLHPKFTDQVIPIYRHHKPKDDWFGLITPSPYNTHILSNNQQIKSNNRQSITQAAKLLDAGHSVCIFPTGTGGKNPDIGTWKAGLGHLISQTTTPFQIFFSYIQGSNRHLFTRAVKPLAFIRLLPQTVTVTIKPARSSPEQSSDPKQIVTQLEHAYNQTFSLNS